MNDHQPTSDTATIFASDLNVPDSSIPFIGLQWPGSAKKAGFAAPEQQFAGLQNATADQISSIKSFYLSNLQRDWDAVSPGLPRTADAILDIGCGVAGIDALLYQHYRQFGQNPIIYLLDKSEVSDELRYGFSGRSRFYASLEEAERLLIANGVPEKNIRRFEVGPELPWSEKIDLVVSLHSWGFHYPLHTYLDYVRSLLLKGGVGITDLRLEKESIEDVKMHFGRVDVLQLHSNRQRIRFSDVLPIDRSRKN